MNNVIPLYKDKSFIIVFTICFSSVISLYHFIMCYDNFIIPKDRYYKDYRTGIQVLDQFQRQIVNEAIILKNTYFGISIINLIIFIVSLILSITMIIGYLDYYRGLIIEVVEYETKPIIKKVIKNKPKEKIEKKLYTESLINLKDKTVTIT